MAETCTFSPAPSATDKVPVTVWMAWLVMLSVAETPVSLLISVMVAMAVGPVASAVLFVTNTFTSEGASLPLAS